MNEGSILALDYGHRRIGLAIASLSARLPRTLTTLDNDPDNQWLEQLKDIIKSEQVVTLVVGRPLNMQGETTNQTALTKKFAGILAEQTSLPIDFQDETLTSKQAEAQLDKVGRPYKKGDIDALAATYILEDWLYSHQGDKL
jgi:putative Holliday junction resolvase